MLGKWFIVVVMSTSTPQLGIDLFVVEEIFKTKEECMTTLMSNPNKYFLGATMKFKGLKAPEKASCIDSNMVNELLNVNLRTKTQI